MERIWFDEGRQNFYAIPDDVELEAGDYLLRSLTAANQRVDRDGVRPYWITREKATDRLGETVDGAWGGLVDMANSLFAMGRAATTGEDNEETERPSVLPEHLEDVLGMKPGALLTEPERVREKLQSVFGITIRTGADAEQDTEDVVEDAEEVTDDSAEEPAGQDPVRDFFSRPEVTGAIAGLGRMLSKLGTQIQEAAGPESGSPESGSPESGSGSESDGEA